MKVAALFESLGKTIWPNGKKDIDGMSVPEFFDRASNLKGVTCNGKITGLKVDGAGNAMTITLTVIEGTKYIIIHDCTGAEWARFVQV